MDFLVRLEVPDRPGALGAVASALGTHGVDIRSMAVVEPGSRVVDDFVVEPPAGCGAAGLAAILAAIPDVLVDTVRPYAPRSLADGLRYVDVLATAGGSGTLTSFAAHALRADWALIVSTGLRGVVTSHASQGAPIVAWSALPWLPLYEATALSGSAPWVPSSWQDSATALVAAPVGAPGRALLLGRRGGPCFRRSEVAAVASVALLAAELEERAPSAAKPAPAGAAAAP